MQRIYQVKIHGRILESSDLKKLLSRAVTEKRAMDKIRMSSDLGRPAAQAEGALSSVQA